MITHIHELKIGGKYEPIMSHVREWTRRSRSRLYISGKNIYNGNVHNAAFYLNDMTRTES